jgi:hypothetical protein
MAKKKKAMSPAEEGLRKLLEGDFQGFWNLPAETKRHLVNWAGSSIPAEEGKEDQEPSAEASMVQLRFVVNLFVSGEANRSAHYPLMKALRKAINKEIKSLP